VLVQFLKDQATEILKAKESERKAQLIAALMDDAAISDILPMDLIHQLRSRHGGYMKLISPEAIYEQCDAVDLLLTSTTCCGLKFQCRIGRAAAVRATRSTSVAYRCLASLDKDPLRKAMIIRTDIFVFEEIGLFSSEYFVALDHILRIIVENSLT